MSRYISESLRQFVTERANYRCEYCGIAQHNTFFAFHLDHIVSLKHGGETSAENLALACQICNLNKGADIATYLADDPNPVRFFNPRNDTWQDHFGWQNSGLVFGKTPVRRATIKILGLNHPDSIAERYELIENGNFFP